jgi:hypothetical protein
MSEAVAVAPRLRPFFALPWIFGARADLAVSIGGMMAGFALFFMYTVIGWNVLWVWFIWVVTLDTPHFFATYFRTYLDKQDRRANRTLLVSTLACFLVGPAALLAAYGLYKAGVPQFKLPMRVFGYGVSLWAYWHIMRQHYGIMRLYIRKNGEIGSTEARRDAVVLYGCLGLSFVALLLRHPSTRPIFGLGDWAGVPATIWRAPLVTLAGLPWDEAVFLALLAAVIGLYAWFVASQIDKLRRGEPVNLPKAVFVSTVVLLHGFMAFSGLLPASTLLGFTAVITIYHDIQYYTVVWFYGRNRYGRTAEERKPFGIAGILARSFPLFLATGIVFVSVPLWGLGCITNRVDICGPGTDLGTQTFMGSTDWILFFALLTAGFQIHHYVLDQFIWRPSRSRQLRQQLNLEAVAAE